MNDKRKIAFCLVAGIAMIGAECACAATADNGYRVIAERNVFNLHDPPNTNVPPPPPPPPPSNVKLTGITSMLGVKRAFFVVAPPAQPGKPPGKEESFIIQEGEREGAIEVLQINEKAATVKIRNEGAETLLALDTSPSLPSGPGGRPGAGPGPGMPGASRMRPPGDRPYAAFHRQSADADQTTVASASALTLASANVSSSSDPSQPLSQPQSPVAPTQQPAQEADMSLEQKALLTEIERQRTQPLVDQGLYPPIPDALGLQSQHGGTQGNGAATPNFPSFSLVRR